MAKYNGHKNYNFWNVSLWLNNDEGLYRTMLDHIRSCKVCGLSKDVAAESFLEDLHSLGITHTPDGVKYTKSAIRAAMVGV